MDNLDSYLENEDFTCDDEEQEDSDAVYRGGEKINTSLACEMFTQAARNLQYRDEESDDEATVDVSITDLYAEELTPAARKMAKLNETTSNASTNLYAEELTPHARKMAKLNETKSDASTNLYAEELTPWGRKISGLGAPTDGKKDADCAKGAAERVLVEDGGKKPLTAEEMVVITREKLAVANKLLDNAWDKLTPQEQKLVNRVNGLQGRVDEYSARLADQKTPLADLIITKQKLIEAQADLDKVQGGITKAERAMVASIRELQSSVKEYSTSLAERTGKKPMDGGVKKPLEDGGKKPGTKEVAVPLMEVKVPGKEGVTAKIASDLTKEVLVEMLKKAMAAEAGGVLDLVKGKKPMDGGVKKPLEDGGKKPVLDRVLPATDRTVLPATEVLTKEVLMEILKKAAEGGVKKPVDGGKGGVKKLLEEGGKKETANEVVRELKAVDPAGKNPGAEAIIRALEATRETSKKLQPVEVLKKIEVPREEREKLDSAKLKEIIKSMDADKLSKIVELLIEELIRGKKPAITELQKKGVPGVKKVK
jgi:hypothetical protein